MVDHARVKIKGIDWRKLGVFLVAFPPFADLTSGMIEAVLMVVGLALMVSEGRLKLPKEIVYWAGLFTAYCLLSYIWASNKSTVVSTTASYIQVVIMIVVILIGSFDEKDAFFIIKCLIAGALVYSVRLFTTYSLSYLLTNLRHKAGNTLSIRFTMLSILIFIDRRHFKIQLLPYLLIALFSFVSMLQGSRKGIVNLSVGLPLVLLLESGEIKHFSKLARNILIILAALFTLYYVCMNTDLYNSIGVRLENTLTFLSEKEAVDASTRDRDLLISDAVRIWLENPIIGVGQDNFRYINRVRHEMYTHNNYLELLTNLGVIGFLIYYSMLVKAYIQSIRLFRLHREYLSISAIVIFTLIFISDYASVTYSSEDIYVFIGYALLALRLSQALPQNNAESLINADMKPI